MFLFLKMENCATLSLSKKKSRNRIVISVNKFVYLGCGGDLAEIRVSIGIILPCLRRIRYITFLYCWREEVIFFLEEYTSRKILVLIHGTFSSFSRRTQNRGFRADTSLPIQKVELWYHPEIYSRSKTARWDILPSTLFWLKAHHC